MRPLSEEKLASRISKVLEKDSPILFAGAGVGCRVGLPSWQGFIEHLASVADQYGDSPSATLIRQRARNKNFKGAATVFKTSELIPAGERWKAISEPFRSEIEDEELQKLEALVGLPFSAILTTNYDTAIHQTATKIGLFPRPVERLDGTLKGASYEARFFIARIHGRAEVPRTMVLADSDYETLLSDQEYLDFVLDVLRKRPCLFIGFSFEDPAIDFVLSLYADRFGPDFPVLHTAIVPSDAAELMDRLHRVNIAMLTYDAENEHTELWRAFRHVKHVSGDAAHTELHRRTVVAATKQGSFGRFMAFAYSQMESELGEGPIVDIVVDGIVRSILREGAPEITPSRRVCDRLAAELRLSMGEAEAVAEKSLERLLSRDEILRDASGIIEVSAESSTLESHIHELSRAVMDRVFVRENLRLHDSTAVLIEEVLQRIFLARAWDVAAHFAGSGTGWSSDLFSVIHGIAADVGTKPAPGTQRAIVAAIFDLLTAPEDREAELLARIGRAAFGLQLVLSTPRNAILQKYSLPARVYLDANILLPAITSGHPMQPVYQDALRRLGEASRELSEQMTVMVGNQFLNEVVSHRRLAIEIVRNNRLQEPDRLMRHVLFRGAADTNVFIGAYGSFVGRRREAASFEGFLEEVAPYENELELAEHLRTLGIESLRMEFFGSRTTAGTVVFSALKEGYERRMRADRYLKDTILVQHEADQLAQLEKDAEEGLRSLFITADRRLRRIVGEHHRLQALAGQIVSRVGLIALVDVMVGLDTDKRSWARLMWSDTFSDEEEAIFEYFVKLGLRRYEEGLALEMQEAARHVAGRAAEEAEGRRLDLFGNDTGAVSRTAAFLDRYEDRFFANWRKAIEERERESRPNEGAKGSI